MTSSVSRSPWVASLQSTVAELVTELFNLLGTGNVPLIAFVLCVTAGVLSCGVLFSYMFVSFCELWTLEATFTAIRTLVSTGLIQNKRFGHVPFKHDQVNNIKYQCTFIVCV